MKIAKHPGLYEENLEGGENRFRIVIRRHGVTHQRYFYYGRRQSRAAALRAAKAEWTTLRETMPVLTPREIAMNRKASASGIVGVRHVVSTSKGHDYESWEANWTDHKGRRFTKRFSIKKYGVRKAKKLAIEARESGLAA